MPRASRPALAASGVALLVAGCGAGPVDVGGWAPEPVEREPCRAFLAGLPDSIADQPRREVEPEDGWGAAYGDPPIVVRCGVPVPDGFDETAVCTRVNGVDWFIPLEQLETDEPRSYTMTAVSRTPMVEVLLPATYFPPATAMADLAAPVSGQLTPRPGC